MRSKFLICLLLVPALTLAHGCAPRTASDAKTGGKPLEPVSLEIVVVDDPPLAAAIAALEPEWKARTGNTFIVTEWSLPAGIDEHALERSVDAIIYPSRLLGPMVEREWIAPLPEDFAANQTLDWSDTFELLQLVATRWGDRPYAVPFGSPVLTCYFRKDLLEKLHRKPPETWSEFRELAALIAKQDPPEGVASDEWSVVAEPLAPGWAAGAFLARAAAYVKHRDHYSTLFHIETMDALVDGPGFVRALEELVADARLGPADALDLDPDEVRRRFEAGRCALAITWPGRARGERSPDSRTDELGIGFAELPGSKAAYNIVSKRWEDREADESRRVTLLGLEGRMGSVTRASSHPSDAFRLLSWLSGPQWGTSTSAASSATTLYRGSQLADPRPWVDPALGLPSAVEYALAVRDALRRQAALRALGIGGQEQYLARLDEAVRQAVRGEAKPAEVLAQVAREWNEITDRRGRDAQRRQYRLSLGLEP